ncbi:MAG: hypothetical protein U0414_33800 [Polyangiaceae bacterium]
MRAPAAFLWVTAVVALAACDDASNSTASTSSSSGAGMSSTASASSAESTGSSTGSSMGGAGGAAGAPFTSKGASSYESQTTLAATPQGGVVAAWIAFFADGTSSIGYAASHDGGALWSAPRYVPAPGGRLTSNPVLAADSQGNFFLAFLGFLPSGAADDHIYVAKLVKGTDTFEAPHAADTGAQRDYDKPSIAVDADDHVLLSWADFTGTPTLVFASSTDGVQFGTSTIANDATFGNLASLCLDRGAGPSAPLYLVHLRQGATLALRKSTDHGQTWPLLASVAPSDVVFQDPSCAVHGADVTVVYASGMAGVSATMNSPGTDVMVLASADGGQSFAPPKSVGKVSPSDQVLFPRVARDTNGKLEIVFYEGVVDAPAKLVRATSADGAAFQLSQIAAPGTFTLDRTIASWLGDYIGVAAPTTGVLSSYADNGEGKAHIHFTAAGAP